MANELFLDVMFHNYVKLHKGHISQGIMRG